VDHVLSPERLSGTSAMTESISVIRPPAVPAKTDRE
jgi:hypothetical protein